MTDAPLPCWRRRLGVFLALAVRLVRGGRFGRFCGRGRRIPGRQPRTVVGCRGGGLEPLCSDGPMGHGRGLAWGLGGGSEICVDSEFVGPAGSSSGNAKVDVAATSGRRPRRHGAWVAAWRSVWTASMSPRLARLRAKRRSFWLVRRGGGPRFWRDYRGLRAVVWIARAMRRLGCAALRLVCGFGAEWCESGRRPRNGGVCLLRWWLRCVGGESPRMCGYSSGFSL